MPRRLRTLMRFVLPLLLFLPILLSVAVHARPSPSKCPRNAYTAVVFVVTNYIAHAFTVVRFPGDTHLDIFERQAYALCAPYVGYLYAFAKMLTFFDSDPGDELTKACHAGAIVYLARGDEWWPRAGDVVYGRVNRPRTGQQSGRDVGKCHIKVRSLTDENPRPTPVRDSQYDQIYKIMREGGTFSVPKGYVVRKCPGNVKPKRQDNGGHTIIKDNGSYPDYTVPVHSELLLVESILALVQLALAIASTSRSASETVEEYGYTAYSLTVLPFAAMSISNGLANATSRNYPFLYFAKTLEMSEARKRITPDNASEGFEGSERIERFEGFAGRLLQIEPNGQTGGQPSWPNDEVVRVEFRARSVDKDTSLSVSIEDPNNGQNSWEGFVPKARPTKSKNRPVCSLSISRSGSNRTQAQTGILTIEVEPNREFDEPNREFDEPIKKKPLGWIFSTLLALVLYFAPVAIAGGLRGFDGKKSTPFQRWAIGVWFWLQGASVVVISVLLLHLCVNNIEQLPERKYRVCVWALRVVLAGAGIMLYVVVGMQMAAIGVCGV